MKIKKGYEIQAVVDDEDLAKSIAAQIRTLKYYAYIQPKIAMCGGKFIKVFIVFKKRKETKE